MMQWARRVLVLLAFDALLHSDGIEGREAHHSHGTEGATSKGSQGAAFQAYLPSWWARDQRDWAPMPQPDAGIDEPFHGQSLQDKHLIDNYFHKRKHLFYLEMGGYDGASLSNTLYLHRALAWRGLLIEANPELYKNMIANRPDDLGVNAASCSKTGLVHFNDANGVGGIVEFMAEGHKETFKDQLENGAITKIPCLPLSSILNKLGVTHIDLWSLDVEGAEMEVLKTFDWAAVTVDVFIIEASGYDSQKDQAIMDLLESQGYIFDTRTEYDNWFHHKRFTPSKSGQ